MKQTRLIMGMPVVVEIADREVTQELFEEVFAYFTYVDWMFSTYKKDSEISAINEGKKHPSEWSDDVKRVFALAEETKQATNGFFDIVTLDGSYDPSGLVKGWAIFNAAQLLRNRGVSNFYIEIAGDIEAVGLSSTGKPWLIGVQNPFNKKREMVKVIHLSDKGVATSGLYARGQHIYNPHEKRAVETDVVSLTVIGPNIYEADRFATAAFAMGRKGIEFIEDLEGFEGYAIDQEGTATFTSGFNHFTKEKELYV